MATSQERSVDVVELDGLRIRLRIKGYPVVLVNAVRRTVLSDVPTMAVDYAYIFDNTTASTTNGSPQAWPGCSRQQRGCREV
ncbi:hypothetical protein [Aeropyrum camini]|uniref:hypothetical protein n=1 Tax=Aeropyrum camini TaxID=229980 RepID=UPI002108F474|nr:hypothetical protein [Aeropyrum camini]